jgi:hypothetical protein
LPAPWNKKIGRPFLGDLLGVAQSTVSRIVTTLVPVVTAVLAEFVPDAKQAMEWVTGRVCLVDGTITPCWSDAAHRKLWSRKHGTTGFTAQLVSLLDGSAVSIFDPLPGKTHDATAFTETPVAKIVEHTGGGIGDKGHQGCQGMVTPRKKLPGGELSKTDNESNAEISALRAPIERLVAHFKSWRIFHTDYRRPYATYHEAYDATRGLFFFSIIWGFE